MSVCSQERPPEAVGHLCPEGPVPEDVLHLHPPVRQQRGPAGRAVPQKRRLCRRGPRVRGRGWSDCFLSSFILPLGVDGYRMPAYQPQPSGLCSRI